MRIVFPKWDASRPWVMSVPGDQRQDVPDHSDILVAMTPQAALRVDDDHRVLVVSGTPSDEHGENASAHAQAGDLGAYWLARRDGQWIVTARRDSLMWTGVSGSVGTVTAVELGKGHPAVVLVGGSCWQGFCGDWLSMIGFDDHGSITLVKGQMLDSSSISAFLDCDDRLSGTSSEADAASAADDDEAARPSLNADNCFDIAGTWHLQPRRGAGHADLVLVYTGRDLAPDPKTGALVGRAISESLVLRYDGGVYSTVSGRDPTHTL